MKPSTSPPPASSDSMRIPVWLLVVVSLALIAVIQWLPFGWNGTPRTDGWTLWGTVDHGLRPYWFSVPDLVTRPFFFWIWLLAYALGSENFVALNLLLLVMAVVRGAALYRLLRQMFPRAVLFAYLSAALLMVFPGDSGTYYLGAAHVLLSFTLQLVALALLIGYWRQGRRWRLALALGIEVISLGNYEAGALIFAAAPLLLLWLDRRFSRRLVITALLWWAAPAVDLAVLVGDLVFNPASHHLTLLDQSSVPLAQKLANVVPAQFWTGYQRGFSALFQPGGYPAAALAIMLIAAVTAIWLRRHYGGATYRARHWLLISLGGLAAMLLGVGLFLPSSELDSFAVFQPYRLFYFSAPGAVVTVTALAFALSQRVKARGALAGLIIVALIGGGALSLLRQHEDWQTYLWRQQRLLDALVRQTGQIEDGTLIFVIDRSDGDLIDYFPFNYVFEGALQVVTGNYSIQARLCYDDAANPDPMRGCRFAPDGIHIPDIWSSPPTYTIPYDRAVGFVLNADHSLTLLATLPSAAYQPRTRFDPSVEVPRRFTMLTYPR